jgi:integral membrane protein
MLALDAFVAHGVNEAAMNMSTALGRLRLVSLLEGWSFVALLFIAMPLKYWGGEPAAVRVVGMAHGVLFLACVLAAVQAHFEYDWPVRRTALVILATLIPFGPFIADRRILKPLDSVASR